MKRYVFIIFLLLFTVESYSSETIKRIDSIVNDITALRKNYEAKLLDEKEKNSALKHENSLYKQKIHNLQSQIKKLQKSPTTKVIVKEKIQKLVLVKPVCEDDNRFPKLKLKKSLNYFKASAFRLREDAVIYAGSRSNQIVAKWEAGTSFTSNVESQTRLKITGYFVNRVWRKADKEMWVDRIHVKKR